MKQGLVAGFFYFLVVGTAGMLFGALREMFLSPVLGRDLAVFVELPFLLGVAWLACNWLVKVNALSQQVLPRLAMGATAFLLVLAMEQSLQFALQWLVVDMTSHSNWRWGDYVGLAGQIAFGLFPLFVTASTEPATG